MPKPETAGMHRDQAAKGIEIKFFYLAAKIPGACPGHFRASSVLVVYL
jgi:hypothetical protein